MNDERFQDLQELVKQQSLMMDSVPIQMWFLTDIFTYGRVNQCHADFMGMRKQAIEFKALRYLFPADVAALCEQSNRQVLETRNTVVSEEWLTDSNGVRHLLEITKTPKFDNNGSVQYIVCCAIIITEQRSAAAALKQHEENFRSFIEKTSDIVVIGNCDGKIIYSNPVTSDKLGYSSDELRTIQILDLHPKSVQQEATSILTDMFTGKRTTCPLPLMHKNGTILPVETRVWFGKWNGADCIYGVSQDLGREQEALQKFDKLFRMNPALMAVSSIPDRIFTDVNDAFLRILGYSADEIIGKTGSEIGIFANEEEQERVANTLACYGNIHEVELKVKTKAGVVLDGLFSGDIIESQGVKYYLTVMIDITERKQAEAERQHTIKELRHALNEIKTLRGIVPICASCKKIRDDKGYWEQVEAYVAKYTEAHFSHGICPECMTKLYPEFCKKKDIGITG